MIGTIAGRETGGIRVLNFRAEQSALFAGGLEA
jgi:hypothetical protein